MFPPPPGYPTYPNPCLGCDPYPDGNVIGPIVAPAVYWTPNYDIVQSPEQGLVGGNSFLLEPMPIYPKTCRRYWHVEIFAVEQQFPSVEVAEELFANSKTPTEKLGAMGKAKPSSHLKVLLEVPSARGERRRIIADIGTGIDMKVGPTTQVTGWLMIPNPEGVVIPAGLADIAAEATATIVTARATPIESQGSTFNGRYTQSRIVPAGGSVLDRIPACARRVEIYVANTSLVNPPTIPAPLGVEVSWVFDQLASDPSRVGPVGYVGSYPGLSAPLSIPGNAKFVNLSSATEQLVTLVYQLSL